MRKYSVIVNSSDCRYVEVLAERGEVCESSPYDLCLYVGTKCVAVFREWEYMTSEPTDIKA